MNIDKKKVNPGGAYRLDSAYSIGDNTYLSYYVGQGIKGKQEGTITMSGVFVLNEEGTIIENYVVDFNFKERMATVTRYNTDDISASQIHTFFKDEKITFVYAQKTKIKGFVVEEEKEIKKFEEITMESPAVNKEKVSDFLVIIPLSSDAFVVKSRYLQITPGKDYTKCDYTMFSIE